MGGKKIIKHEENVGKWKKNENTKENKTPSKDSATFHLPQIDKNVRE